MERTGSARWLGSPEKEDLLEGTALLRIVTDKGVETICWVFADGVRTRLMKMDGTTYSVNLVAGTCSCPDHQKRQLTCKHVKALRAALPKVK